MNEDRLEHELRAALLQDDPGAVREELRRRAAAVPDEEWPRRGFVRSPGMSRLLASLAAVTVVAVAGVIVALAVGLRGATVGLAPSTHPSAVSPSPSQALSAASTTASSSFVLVPWLNATPTPEASPTAAVIPPSTRPCATAGLKAWVYLGGGAMAGAIIGDVNVANVGAAPCTLAGPPSMITIRGSGGALSVPFRAVDAPAPGTEAFTAPGPVLLGPGAQAYAWLFWDNWCGSTKDATTLQVALPSGGGVLTLAPSSTVYPRCNAPNVGSSLSAWRFALAQPPPPNQTVVSGHVTIAAPPIATPGEMLTFIVTLTNLGSAAAPLDPCPTYSETLVVNGAALKPPAYRDYVLNCAALRPSIAPGESVHLQMQYQVPTSVAPGQVELLWSLDPGSPFDSNTVIGRVPLTIVSGP